MFAVSDALQSDTGSAVLGPARVLESGEASGKLWVRLAAGEEREARVALASPELPGPGDTVLVAGLEGSEYYIIGLLDRKNPVSSPSPKLDLGDGAYAAVQGSPEEQTLRVFSKQNQLVFEYDPKAEKARVTVEAGDLEFVTTRGDITLRSGRDVRIAGRAIVLNGRAGIQMAVFGVAQRLRSCFTLGRRKAKLESTEVAVAARRGKLKIEETDFQGRKLSGEVGQVRWVIGRLETIAKTIRQQAGNLYRKVEGLSQLTTGRMRTLVRSTLHLKAKKVSMKSEDDFKITGEKIHLG